MEMIQEKWKTLSKEQRIAFWFLCFFAGVFTCILPKFAVVAVFVATIVGAVFGVGVAVKVLFKLK